MLKFKDLVGGRRTAPSNAGVASNVGLLNDFLHEHAPQAQWGDESEERLIDF